MLNPNALTADAGSKDAIVVIGAQGEMVKTPLGPASLASVIGESIENLAGNAVLARPGWARLLEALVLAVAGRGHDLSCCASGWAGRRRW